MNIELQQLANFGTLTLCNKYSKPRLIFYGSGGFIVQVGEGGLS